MNHGLILGWSCMGGAALGVWLGYRVAPAGGLGVNMLIGALMFLFAGVGVLAALAPGVLVRVFREKGRSMERTRGAPMGGIIWAWLVFGLAHSVLGDSQLWWWALAGFTALGLVGLWRLQREVVLDE
jgi:hypothetical protein